MMFYLEILNLNLKIMTENLKIMRNVPKVLKGMIQLHGVVLAVNLPMQSSEQVYRLNSIEDTIISVTSTEKSTTYLVVGVFTREAATAEKIEHF